MAHAYSILAHKNPEQLERLLSVLWHGDDLFVVHIDARAPRALHEMARGVARRRANVLLQRPRAVLWGGSQIHEVQIEAAGIALEQSRRWTHFINLTGQDYPVRRRAAVVGVLAGKEETSFVDWFDPSVRRLWSNLDDRLGRRHLHWPWLHRLLDSPFAGRRIRAALGWTNQLPYVPGWRRRRPTFFRYLGGSNYVVLSRAACEYLCRDLDALRIRRWLADSGHPDESVYPSVMLNGPLATTVERRNWHYLQFAPNCSHPATLRIDDFERLAASDAWFARKFDTAVDAAVLDRIDRELLASSAAAAIARS